MPATPLPLCVRINADDGRSADALRIDGWRFVEVLETWRRRLDRQWFPQPHIRQARSSDREACVEIARTAFVHDRLHSDRAVPAEVADGAKMEWVKASFCAPENILVADRQAVLGFVLLKRANDTVVVDLIAVAQHVMGQGLGKELVRAAMRWGGPEAKWIEAGTQATNEPARALYESLGFAVHRAQRTFHKSQFVQTERQFGQALERLANS